MTSAAKLKAQLMAECALWLAQEQEEQEACQKREEEEFVREMAELKLREEEEWKAWKEEERKVREAEEQWQWEEEEQKAWEKETTGCGWPQNKGRVGWQSWQNSDRKNRWQKKGEKAAQEAEGTGEWRMENVGVAGYGKRFVHGLGKHFFFLMSNSSC